jgi:hypothetical protein
MVSIQPNNKYRSHIILNQTGILDDLLFNQMVIIFTQILVLGNDFY